MLASCRCAFTKAPKASAMSLDLSMSYDRRVDCDACQASGAYRCGTSQVCLTSQPGTAPQDTRTFSLGQTAAGWGVAAGNPWPTRAKKRTRRTHDAARDQGIMTETSITSTSTARKA